MEKVKSFLTKTKEYLFADDRKLRSRALFGAFASFVFVLNFFIYGPVDIYFGNSRHLVYSLSEFLLPVILGGAVGFFLCFGLSLILRGRAYNWYVTFLGGLSFASFLQVMFLNSSVVLLDGNMVHWEHYAGSALFGLAVWVGVLLVLFALHRFAKNAWKNTMTFLCVLVCFVQVVSIVSGAFIGEIDPKSPIMATSEGELDFSAKHNVVVISVDSFDIRYTEEVMQNSPEYFEEFDGFTWYKNTMSHNSRTYPNIAVILTGKECLYDKPCDEYMAEAWKDNKFLEDIKSAGYDSRLYIDATYVSKDLEYISEYTSNYIETDRAVDYLKLEKNILGLSIYRSFPVALKPFFETDTSKLNSAMGSDEYELCTKKDSDYYRRLTEEGINLNAEKGEKGTFTYFHFDGCHAPYTFDKNCISTSRNLTIKDAARGVLTNISELLNQFKKLGIYDSSDIIITTDHGYAGNETELSRERVATLFYKPAGARGEIKEDNSPQQLMNIRPTVMKAMGIKNYRDYGTPFDEVSKDADVKRYFYMSAANENGSVREYELVTYEVVGDANDFSNWKKIDRRPIEYPFLKG